MDLSTLTYEETRHNVTIDGAEFSYHVAGDESLPTVILLHGSGPGVSSWSNFQHNLPVLSQSFRVFMPDMPGFGKSDLPEIDAIYPIFTARWLLTFMDAVGIRNASLVGNSMGGYVAAETAALAPERIDRIALMGPGGLAISLFNQDPSEGAKRLFEFLDNPTRAGMIEWVKCMVSDHSAITDALIDERMANALQPGAIERAKTIFGSVFNPEFAAQQQPLWQRASTIATPTLIMWGRDDRMLPYEQAHFAARHMPDVELHMFSRCGHWAQIERKADFERLVTEFFTR